jgi:acetyltransferase-like isoleucine patch superfamily enzyme
MLREALIASGEAASNARRLENAPFDDPLMWIGRSITKAHSLWLKKTYPFAAFGHNVSIHHSCELRRNHAWAIRIGDFVLLDRDVWINVPVVPGGPKALITIGSGTNIGRRSVISAVTRIEIQENVLLAPAVFVTDHNHEYSDPDVPICNQGVRSGGSLTIESNCWLGYGSMVIASHRDVIVGRNSVVGAYSVVTQSCPPHSVVVGNPARVVNRYDMASGQWLSPGLFPGAIDCDPGERR